MVKRWFVHHSRLLRVCLSGGSLLAFGSCGLSDQQLSSIAQSVITTGLGSFVTNLLSSLLSAGTTG